MLCHWLSDWLLQTSRRRAGGLDWPLPAGSALPRIHKDTVKAVSFSRRREKVAGGRMREWRRIQIHPSPALRASSPLARGEELQPDFTTCPSNLRMHPTWPVPRAEILTGTDRIVVAAYGHDNFPIGASSASFGGAVIQSVMAWRECAGA